MPLHKEALFPASYRTVQVRQIMDAIARVRSIAIYGLAGMGKSNIFRFLVAHPQVKEHYLGSDAARFEFVFVDCNLCDARHADRVLQELNVQLERHGIGLPENRTPAGAVREAVRARLETFDPTRVLVILFDPLDEAFQAVENNFWTYLRALRDLAGNVVFILGARRPPPPLRELQELLTETCWVTPLSRQDAYDSLARDAKRLNVAFSDETRTQLFEVTGGHPGLLKNAAEWVGRAQTNLKATPQMLIQELLAREAIQEVCRDLWCDLMPEANATQRLTTAALDGDMRALDFLERVGVVRQGARGFEIFSPLFAAYIQAQMPRLVRVWVGMNHMVNLETAHSARTFHLPEGLFLLLRALAQQPAHELTLPQLSRVLYTGELQYSAQALAAQLRRLRNALNQQLRPMLDDDAFNALLSERKHSYQLNLEAANDWRIEYHVLS